MRSSIRLTLIAGGAALALGLGTAAAVAATGGGGDDAPGVVEHSGTPAPVLEDRLDRPTPSDLPAPVPTAVDDHGSDDPATHDIGDDHGSGGHGADD
ncbi:hypothetical protein [Leifsonia sp. fls2-241-R2A-40a]|uniref:hypothetical protein n=1 Tax=Leifsonia sp. fls2-241-R2A-40a TaxID=3040290 RepID=UPI0025509788|nr:hypothetical protein [Leifsonia sp. fls2-241-R2A-40a]